MGKVLTIDEMLSVLRYLNDSEFIRHRHAVEQVGTHLAATLCSQLDVEMDDKGATFEGVELGGTACHVYPKLPDQPLPHFLEGYDPSGEWRARENNSS